MASNVQRQQQEWQHFTTTTREQPQHQPHQQQQQEQEQQQQHLATTTTTTAVATATVCHQQQSVAWFKPRLQQQQQQHEQQEQLFEKKLQLQEQYQRSHRRLPISSRAATSTTTLAPASASASSSALRSCGVRRLCNNLDALRKSSRQLQFGSLATLLLLLLLLTTHGDFVQAEGNVGCQFVRTLCISHAEVCYDDNIFGKCIPTTGVDVEDIENTPLTEDQSRLLANMLEELQGAGLGWDHHYVQCRIQGALFSLQRQQQLPPNLCANLAPSPPDYADPASALAYVRFTSPEQQEQQMDYYEPEQTQLYPMLRKKQSQNSGFNSILQQLQQVQERRDLRHDPLELEHFGKLDGHEKSTQLELPSIMDAFLDTERQRMEREQQLRLAELADANQKTEQQNRLELYQILAASEPDPQPYQRKQQPANAMDKLEAIVEQQQQQQQKQQRLQQQLPQQQQKQEQDQPQPANVFVPEEVKESSELYFPENFSPLKRRVAPHSFFRELTNDQHMTNKQVKRRPDIDNVQEQQEQQEAQELALVSSLRRNSLTPLEEEAMLASNSYPRTQHNQRAFTEGGLLLMPQQSELPQDSAQADEPADMKQALLANMLGFARHERLDVKKPGPQLGPPAEVSNQLETEKPRRLMDEVNKEVLPAHIKGGDVNEPYKKKKIVKEQHSDEDHAPHTVDTEYAHVFVKNPIDSWYDGQRIMNELAQILHMQGYFSYLTVQPHEVSFRVDSNNPDRRTAADVARYINENRGVKNNIQRRVGFYVLHAGVGDRVKDLRDPSITTSHIELAEQGPDVTHIMAYMFAGAGAAAVIVIFATLILIKRHDRKRDKLGGLQSGMSGAESCSKDYQELCRARMAGKNGNATPANGGNGGSGGGAAANTTEPSHSGRITSLSKESEGRPPSSRSSTSSWSEEPALTNMDISTGHMVLSYMEDHLRNKGRLQREWEALCRYEAEPSAREAASQPQCVNFNRPGAPLPYDHSRVVLNHLANAEGLDYVNASTITDHDPRAPAYVAAQGPLPSTLAHFWQMIWEQGAVVIVALCRLQENGEVACARYWPEEGAEVYHIYEVHLVSEHIWCDDYLVRSFYLKNLRTSETRTVTQFHFLSWPQMGVPAQAKALLDFRRKVNKSYRGRSCPIVVHGSAGAGRTGSYLLLDLVLGRMNKGAREIDIAATLEHLRDQRAGLVATRQQFEFVLMAVAEEVHAILKALPANTSGEKRELDKDSGAAKEPLKEDKAQEAVEEKEEEEAPTSSTKAAAAAAAKEKLKEMEPPKESPKEQKTPAKTQSQPAKK